MPTSAPDRVTGRLARVALLLLLASSAGLYGCAGGSGAGSADPTPPDSGTPPPTPPTTAGKVTLNWAQPTSNEDGSALTDLAGYRVYYGQSADALDNSVDVRGAGLTTVEIGLAASGTWYFAIASYNTTGVESMKSDVVSTTI